MGKTYFCGVAIDKDAAMKGAAHAKSAFDNNARFKGKKRAQGDAYDLGWSNLETAKEFARMRRDKVTFKSRFPDYPDDGRGQRSPNVEEISYAYGEAQGYFSKLDSPFSIKFAPMSGAKKKRK